MWIKLMACLGLGLGVALTVIANPRKHELVEVSGQQYQFFGVYLGMHYNEVDLPHHRVLCNENSKPSLLNCHRFNSVSKTYDSSLKYAGIQSISFLWDHQSQLEGYVVDYHPQSFDKWEQDIVRFFPGLELEEIRDNDNWTLSGNGYLVSVLASTTEMSVSKQK